jgi:DNA-directed RNA polymerase subunit M/transcription elongation factor TFIIS
MSEKMECPGCGSHTSAIRTAYEDGMNCPQCGLSARATEEILRARRTTADKDLKGKLEVAIQERDRAQRQLAWADKRLWKVGHELEALLKRINSPLREEQS